MGAGPMPIIRTYLMKISAAPIETGAKTSCAPVEKTTFHIQPCSMKGAIKLPSRKDICLLLTAIVLFVLCSAPTAWTAPNFPDLTGRVVDNANLLTAADETALTQQLAELEQKSSDQLVVVTLRSLQGYSIEDFGYQLGRHWGIGQKETNNGVLLIVAPKERKVRIEVGYGLEPLMTDIMSTLIIHNAILPEFRRGNFVNGIKAGVRDIKAVLLGNANEVKQRLAQKTEPSLSTEEIITLTIWILIIAYLIYCQIRDARDPEAAAKRRKRNGNIVIVPGGGGWGGGWSGGRGGGGWSGGGGGFGGGGGSGSW